LEIRSAANFSCSSGSLSQLEFAEIALQLGEHPVGGRLDSWLDADEVVELIAHLREADYYGRGFDEPLPHAKELADLLEDHLITILEWRMASDDLERVSDAVEEWGDNLSDKLKRETSRAILAEINDIEQNVAEEDSDSTLEDYAKTLQKLSPRARVPPEKLQRALVTVTRRISEINERTSVAPAPSASGRLAPEKDTFGDDELRSLFAPLLAE